MIYSQKTNILVIIFLTLTLLKVHTVNGNNTISSTIKSHTDFSTDDKEGNIYKNKIFIERYCHKTSSVCISDELSSADYVYCKF